MELDLEQQAKARLERTAYDYYAGGAGEESTVRDNLEAWSRRKLRPHMLRDVSTVSVATSVLGTSLKTPIMIAPLGYQKLARPEGELAMARGAAQAGALMVVSTLATTSLEDIAEAVPGAPRWFQVYVHRDRGWTAELLQRAAAAGYTALVFTVDTPVLGVRPRDERNAFSLPAGMRMANSGKAVPTPAEGSGLETYAGAMLETALSFDDIGWLREVSGLPVVVKGILRADDALECVQAGAAAITVSNHGGRQLDTAIATADVLPEIAHAVGDRAEVYVDGGIRRGADVVKALALGAKAVMLGRPALWALTVGGATGVSELLEALAADTGRTLALCGVCSVSELTPDLVCKA
jgi:4-hydroxymandelate oxidase